MEKYSFFGYIPIFFKDLPEGCKLCLSGRKSVIFSTGLCKRNCFYCPVSLELKQKDIVLVNGFQVNSIDEIIDIIEKHKSLGCSFTGGEPLIKYRRVLNIGKAIKEYFGENFHIHLYTGITNIPKKALLKLSNYIDEIRFHLRPFQKIPKTIILSKKVFNDCGIEIPVFPNKIWSSWVISLLPTLEKYDIFLNLNELEITESNFKEMVKRRFKPSKKRIGAISRSRSRFLDIYRFILREKLKVRVHFCPVFAKDYIQQARRNYLYNISVKNNYEAIDGDGLRFYIESNLSDLSKEFLNKMIKYNKCKIENNKVLVHPSMNCFIKNYKIVRFFPDGSICSYE